VEQRTKRAKTQWFQEQWRRGGGIVVFGKVERRWGTDGTMCNVQCELCRKHIKEMTESKKVYQIVCLLEEF